jgi:hypothetical protein
MKKFLPIIITALIAGGVGFYTGQSNGYEDAQRVQSYRGVESIKLDLKEKEKEIIRTLLSGSAKIERKNEGSLFKSKYVKYLTGELKNKALIARAKDIKVKVTFISKTNTEIGSEEFTVYEFIEPGKSKSFKKRISITEDVAEFNWNILDAKSE